MKVRDAHIVRRANAVRSSHASERTAACATAHTLLIVASIHHRSLTLPTVRAIRHAGTEPFRLVYQTCAHMEAAARRRVFGLCVVPTEKWQCCASLCAASLTPLLRNRKLLHANLQMHCTADHCARV
eukprot:IDg16056t1